MNLHAQYELMFSIVALINIVTAVIIYHREHKQGITAKSGSRYQAVMSCAFMAILFGGASFSLVVWEIAHQKT